MHELLLLCYRSETALMYTQNLAVGIGSVPTD